MEALNSDSDYLELKYQVMGESGTHQFLQVVLYPYQYVVTNEQAIQYWSEDVKIVELFSLRERFFQFMFGQYPEFGVVVFNPTATVQYVGLSMNTGSILVHDLNFTINLGHSCQSESKQKEMLISAIAA